MTLQFISPQKWGRDSSNSRAVRDVCDCGERRHEARAGLLFDGQRLHTIAKNGKLVTGY
jgi:hypothetical protein